MNLTQSPQTTEQASGTDATTAVLVDLERRRCEAMIAADRDALKELLHPDLLHVHAKGQLDSFDTYIATGGFSARYVKVERFDDLRVRVIGPVAALMTGRQLLEVVRYGTGERVRIDSQVMQVWKREAGRWQQLAFQTTPMEMTVEPPEAAQLG